MRTTELTEKREQAIGVRIWYPIKREWATFMTRWDVRSFVRALAVTLLALALVWLVTAATDEGQLAASVHAGRAGRTLPIAPFCSAVGAALALGTARVREETRALEALGRSPSQTARAAALGSALPSLLIGLAIGTSSQIDISGFYPRAPRVDTFVYTEADHSFTSATLGVRIASDGDAHPVFVSARQDEDNLPPHARAAASLATAAAGLALSVVAAAAVMRVSLQTESTRRRRRFVAGVQALLCALLMLVAFQASAARVTPALLAVLPPALLLVRALLGYRARHVYAA